MEALASGGRYGLPHSRELQKDNMPPSPSSHAHSVVSSTSSKPSPEVLPYKRPCLENGHPSGHLYLPQNEAYLNHSMTYANRYLHYPIPDSMALHPLSLTGKGPVYPHPVLVGGSSLYPTHLAPKHALPYHNIPGGPGGEYLAYNSQEMAHPLMHPHSDGKHSERGDPKSRGQEKPRTAADEFSQQRRNEKDPNEISEIRSVREMGAEEQERSQSKTTSITSRENIVCIDLVHSDTDIDNEPTPTVHQKVSTEPATKNDQNDCCESNLESTKTAYEPKLSQSFSGSQVASPKSNKGLRNRSPVPSPRMDIKKDTDPENFAAEKIFEKEDSIVDLGESQGEAEEEEDDSNHNSSKNCRGSSLAKRIANSSGYVGDRFKCVTTELYADSSKLSREQRALQVSNFHSFVHS
uniref:BCL6 corepressor n=1 Tax=Periophthalmus magnuspinnatus TaxID=409849 RepID=A0A3B3ZZH0_9GOBI